MPRNDEVVRTAVKHPSFSSGDEVRLTAATIPLKELHVTLTTTKRHRKNFVTRSNPNALRSSFTSKRHSGTFYPHDA
jgi:hypothetical protein